MMKTKLLALTLGALCFAPAILTSCDTYELYEINAPGDLQDKIDSIAASKNTQSGDTLNIDILVANVGADDNSAGWWTEFSQYFTIPANRLLHIEFENYGSGANNWNNWNVCVCNGERDGDGYSEYFVLRSDAYGWGNADYSGAMIHMDYPETLEGEDMWATFREKMQGAKVVMEIDHSRTGNCYLTATHTAKDGTVFTETYEQPVSSTSDINAFLICDGSHFIVKKAYTITSKVQAVDDVEAEQLIISGQPEAVEVGCEDVWGNAVATVIFADGSSAVAEREDLTITAPDMSTPGTKTVIVSYSKTKQGNYGKSVAAYYNVEVNNPVAEIAVVSVPFVTTYYYYDGVIAPVATFGLEVNAVFVDGTTGNIPLSNLEVSSLQPVAGTQDVVLTYGTGDEAVSTTFPVEVVEGTGMVGAPDFTNGWWSTFTEDHVVAAGESYTFKMTLLSDNLENWHSPCTILRRADLSEYAVVRMDNFGWGDSYGTAVLESNWNWDVFVSSMNGSEVSITVTNNGDGTANINYEVVYTNGEVHFQNYNGIAVDSADVQTALVTEESCLILHD